MSSPRRQWLRTRAVLAVVLLPAVTGCAAAPAPDAAPAISAASQSGTPEWAMSERLPDVEWPEAPPVATTAVATTIAATEAATPVAGQPDAVAGDPRGVEVMAMIDFAWRRALPGWSIEFLPARVELRGLTRVDARRIEIYVRDTDTAASLARVVAHELGHAIDVELNSSSDRERWRAARGVSPLVSWWPGNAVADFDTLAGDFAEAFATLLTGSVSLSRVAPPPDDAALALVAELAGAR